MSVDINVTLHVVAPCAVAVRVSYGSKTASYPLHQKIRRVIGGYVLCPYSSL